MRVDISHAVTPEWGVPFAAQERVLDLPVHAAPLPAVAIVPLLQHSGAAAEPIVAVGDVVHTGQPIGTVPDNALGARVHAPLSGRIVAIEKGPVPGRRDALCVHIENDGNDTRWQGYTSQPRPLSLSTSALRHAVIEAGIVGLGGATFPAGVKLNRGSGVNTLILNAAECEPVINCDDALMRQDSDMMLLGAQIMLRILEADECIVALKQGMSRTLEIVTAAIDRLDDDRFRIVLVPSVYPVGGEAQLIQMLTGDEIPSGGLPWDSGAICQNVGTAAAIAHFLTLGEPLISRLVTVCGGGISKPGNYVTRIGTPIRDLLTVAGGQPTGAATVIMGGPMMGIALDSIDMPVTKATNCLYVPTDDELTAQPEPVACIRCGDCATVCPAALTPQILLQTLRTNDYDSLQRLGLPDCIECGCCDYVCPSHIPLTREFIRGKQQLWQIGFEKRRAEQAAKRVNAREQRLATAERNDADAELHDVSDGDAAKARLDELLRRVDDENNAP
ncbi:MAG: electron transport complex subunit RsxC [Gammaproteobacteria bacterium]|nr:electron transport complex subunit RsxC [Gammaproteobacteria bacterium]